MNVDSGPRDFLYLGVATGVIDVQVGIDDDPQVRQIPPSSLEVTFNVNEGPKVKVGEIKILGNEVMGKRE